MTRRLFIAINLPNNLKEKLGALIIELEKRNKNLPIKWVNANQFHLTLHFLGYLKEKKSHEVQKIIKETTKNFRPFKMKIEGLGAFPNLKNPRIIFINSKEINTHQAQELQKSLGNELAKLGIKIDNRPWQEHITLGRVKAKCQPKIPRVEITDSEFEVNSLELMQSQLSPTGSHYTVIESFELK